MRTAVSFSFAPTQAAIAFIHGADGAVIGVESDGSRIHSIAIFNSENQVIDKVVENRVLVGDPNREIRIVTLNFLAAGGDGYPFAELGFDRVNLIDDTAPTTGEATVAPNESERMP